PSLDPVERMSHAPAVSDRQQSWIEGRLPSRTGLIERRCSTSSRNGAASPLAPTSTPRSAALPVPSSP
ncbi:MAG TPA: hypothetical protein H9786_08500, partial [Candidatus Brachybacterium merdavium]|nr:hypothetical protein [Candidatus Brachybacterium merdavium]